MLTNRLVQPSAKLSHADIRDYAKRTSNVFDVTTHLDKMLAI